MKKAIFIMLVIGVGYYNCLQAQGSEINVNLKDGRQVSGELLYLDTKTIVITTEIGTKEENLISGNGLMYIFPTDTIKEITVIGKSKILSGIAIGTITGIGLVALIGLASGDDSEGFIRLSAGEKAAILGIFLGAVGLVVGLISGIFSSSSDKQIEPRINYDYSELEKYARYKTKPEFLIIRSEPLK